MIAFIALTTLFAITSAQYNYQGYQNGQPQPYQPQQQQSYNQQPQQQYQPQQQQAYQPQPQDYQPQRPQQQNHNPAAVHYVNIGAQLQGDYKFGYDTGKGNDGQSFREETRMPDGSVQGAYGYVDDTGRQRIVKYTAGKDGYKAEVDGVPQGGAAAPAQQGPQQQYNNYNDNNGYQSGNYQ